MTDTFPMNVFVVHNADLRVFGYDIAVMVTKEDLEGLKNVVRSLGDKKLTYTSYKTNDNGKTSLFIRTRIDPKQKDSLMGKDLIFTINPSTGTGDLILVNMINIEVNRRKEAIEKIRKYERMNSMFGINKVIFNNPATIVFWNDGTKTVVKCGKNDKFDPEKGLSMAISKKALGNTSSYYNTFKKVL